MQIYEWYLFTRICFYTCHISYLYLHVHLLDVYASGIKETWVEKRGNATAYAPCMMHGPLHATNIIICIHIRRSSRPLTINMCICMYVYENTYIGALPPILQRRSPSEGSDPTALTYLMRAFTVSAGWNSTGMFVEQYSFKARQNITHNH